MRARALALSILSSAAVLAIGWQLGAQGQSERSGISSSADAGSTKTGAGAGVSPPTAPATPATTPPPAVAQTGTFTGASTSTPFGDVQVQIRVDNGTIADVIAVQLTDREQKSVSISNRAAPVLRQEVLAAQSANVQGVSGATYTSDAYLTSLQSAIDQSGR